jgi:hypothetical protein
MSSIPRHSVIDRDQIDLGRAVISAFRTSDGPPPIGLGEIDRVTVPPVE